MNATRSSNEEWVKKIKQERRKLAEAHDQADRQVKIAVEARQNLGAAIDLCDRLLASD